MGVVLWVGGWRGGINAAFRILSAGSTYLAADFTAHREINSMEDSRPQDDAHQQKLIDRYLSSRSSYWSAQLAISGLLLTFFSADVVTSSPQDPLFNYILIGVCIASIWLLLVNFRSVSRFYLELGSTTAADMPEVPEEIKRTARTEEDIRRLVAEHTAPWRNQQMNRTHYQREAVKLRENVVDGLLVLETLLVVLILVSVA